MQLLFLLLAHVALWAAGPDLVAYKLDVDR